MGVVGFLALAVAGILASLLPSASIQIVHNTQHEYAIEPTHQEPTADRATPG
jgi:hypothetical protein